MVNGLPPRQGLYDPLHEHDACGLNFVCDMLGRASHRIVELGIEALCALEHRGAAGADPAVGDGAGILVQMPDEFLRGAVGFVLPPVGEYATGMAFLPQGAAEAATAKTEIQRVALEEGLVVLGWRDVPISPDAVGAGALVTMPSFAQPFFATADGVSGIDLDRKVFIARKRFENEIGVEPAATQESGAMGGAPADHRGVYFPSLSSRTIVYKGMLTTGQLGPFYPDLTDPAFKSAIALVHSRFSTNTFPSWPLAHPYRLVAHNGEINTIRGNRNWMKAREASLSSDLFGEDLAKLFPICTPGASDTAGFDECLELLTLSGYSMAEAILMMIPEPWENHESMSADRKAFYEYFATLIEPWDGPASVTFSDGKVVGAVLDRNGLRPSRYWVTSDNLVVMASEVGVIEIDQSTVIEKGRVEPGRIFMIDTEQGRILRDDEIKRDLSARRPYADLVERILVPLEELPTRADTRQHELPLETSQLAFGYSLEDLKILLTPMVEDGKEALGSMGTDTPIAALSTRSRLLYDYFQQLFAQVTNPPLDAIREELITAVSISLGPRGNLLDPGASSVRQIRLEHPALTADDFARLLPHADAPAGLRSQILDIVYPVGSSGDGMAKAIAGLREQAEDAVSDGVTILILSDRAVSRSLAPIPALLATSAIHHHLVKNGTRSKADIVVETGEAREVHHIALLLGFGARAVYPYTAFDTIQNMVESDTHQLGYLSVEKAFANYVKALDKGLLKITSKMGISTIASYTGAQIFESIGLGHAVTHDYFDGWQSRLGGVTLDGIAADVEQRHLLAFPSNPSHRAHRGLEVGGQYRWRSEGEYHLFNPDTVYRLQHATRQKRFDIFGEYTSRIDEQSKNLATLRGLFTFRIGDRAPVPISEVEPVSEIVKRFSTGAMSYGSISAEAHETLAIAMNRLGGKSNTGEGGEDAERFIPLPNGDSRRSAIKQIASGRFGVTSNYLVNADDIQIKMAQGAKPGEGGQLPGHKVYPWIARTRGSTPGVGLISPPPHHDIYSIEDLAQLIYDLKNANPDARVHVKLVSELGVGTVAAGVSKAHADVVLISGHDGGTGAAPLTSVKHAGSPWELGLAETQQTLLMNGLRDRIVVQVDGQLKTGRDVIVAALLGADEYGFATAPLVVMGCVMMRVCHLNTCPVGVATQDPELRKKFSGQPEFVVTFFEFIAEEVRQFLAELGFRSLAEAIGQVESLDFERAAEHPKAAGLDLSPILYVPPLLPGESRRNTGGQNHRLDEALDTTLIEQASPALERGSEVHINLAVRNGNRSVGTRLGYELTKRYGEDGLPDNTITVNLTGSSGNSFGAFVPRGITLRLTGDANDYVGKGLSGGRIVVRPSDDMACVAEDNIVAGNVIGYGATGGELYLRGRVGERFCVRNSGAVAVVEGVGDHGCEYMTGGIAVVLGMTGRNFAAGMSGGVAYVYDEDGDFAARVNHEMVDIDEPTADDEITIRSLIDAHTTETGSDVGIRVLADWDTARSFFAKVMPRDYKRVLEAEARALAAGSDPIDAIMASAKERGARHG